MESLHYGAIIRLQGIMSCFHIHALLYIQYKTMVMLNPAAQGIMLNPVKQNEQKNHLKL